MADDRVSITINNNVADVRLTRGAKRNALDLPMFEALADAGEQLKAQPLVRAIVLSGEGPSFCAGLDFGAMAGLAASGANPVASASADAPTNRVADVGPGRITHLAQQVAWVWQEIQVPVIAALHGHAIGGGIQIALGADIRIVHPDTKMSVREVQWGLIPDMTGTLMLSQLVRADVAKELVMTARLFDGREAMALGLATKLSERPYEDAIAMASDIAARSPHAIREAKALLNGLLNKGAAEQFAAERSAIAKLIGSPNQIEAVAANFEKRSPNFSEAT